MGRDPYRSNRPRQPRCPYEQHGGATSGPGGFMSARLHVGGGLLTVRIGLPYGSR